MLLLHFLGVCHHAERRVAACLQIVSGLAEQLWGVSKPPNPQVAVLAQKPSHEPRVVVVIRVQALCIIWCLAANCASPFSCGSHCDKLLRSQGVPNPRAVRFVPHQLLSVSVSVVLTLDGRSNRLAFFFVFAERGPLLWSAVLLALPCGL